MQSNIIQFIDFYELIWIGFELVMLRLMYFEIVLAVLKLFYKTDLYVTINKHNFL